MEESPAHKLLTDLLEDAADDKPGAREAFFDALLRTEVFVPLVPNRSTSDRAAIIGDGQIESEGLQTIEYEGQQCLPIFTEKAFVEAWAEREIPCTKKSFSGLLWLVPEDAWMYLNPGQEIGKELTAWELSQLRIGAESIPDLVLALEEGSYGDLEIKNGEDLFDELKAKIRPTLELYPELEEAFLVGAREPGSELFKPMLGLSWGKVNQAKKIYIKDELENIGSDFFSDPAMQMIVVDDLDKDASPHHRFFAETTPFYFAPRAPGAAEKLGFAVKNAGRKLFGKALSEKSSKPDDSKPEGD